MQLVPIARLAADPAPVPVIGCAAVAVSGRQWLWAPATPPLSMIVLLSLRLFPDFL